MKPLKDMDFTELVDFAAGHILKELIKGEFRSAVWQMMNMAIEWKLQQQEAE